MSEKNIDQRTDVWSMGVIVFEALTGRRPLEFQTLGQMYTAFLQGKVPSLRDAAPDVPEDVALAVDHCLRKDRDTRAPNLGTLIEVLRRYTDVRVSGATSGGRVVPPPSVPLSFRSGADTHVPSGDAATVASNAPLSSGRRALPSRRLFASAIVLLGAVGAGATWMIRHPAPLAGSAATSLATTSPASSDTPPSSQPSDTQGERAQAPAPAAPSASADSPQLADAAAASATTGGAHPPRRPRANPSTQGVHGPAPSDAPAHGISPQLPY